MGKLFSRRQRMSGKAEGRTPSGISAWGWPLLAVILAFIAGTRLQDITSSVGPYIGLKPAAGSLDLTGVETVYRQLAANYDGRLDTQKLIAGAADGLVAAAGDPYTEYFDKQEAKQFDNDLSGKVGAGIGAVIGQRNGQPTVVRVLAGNPAETVGLKAGDAILRVNDEDVSIMTTEETVKRVRGDAGTSVRLTVKRGDETKDFNITRAEINNPSVYSSVENGIGIMTITRFDREASGLAKMAARKFADQRVKGVVLDLRDNGGGYLDAAQDIAGIWLNNSVVVTVRKDGKVIDTLRTGTSPILPGVKTVVLINGGTASASEIVAGALKDNGAATLIGEKSFGKGSVQKLIDLKDDTKLKVTIERWYTPAGKNITKEGIKPDQAVTQTPDDTNAGRDVQLDAAKKTLE